MSLKKRIVAGLGALAIALPFTGCTNRNEWIMKTETQTVSTAEYIVHVLNKASEAYSLNGLTTTEDIFEYEVDGKDAAEWISEKAEEQARLQLAISEKFDELGLTLTATELQTLRSSATSSYSSFVSSYGSDMGVSEETYCSIYELSYKEEKILNAIYGEGGDQEVSQDDLKAYYSEHAAKFLIISFTKSGTEETDESTLETIDGYLESINSGEDTFENVYVTYYTNLGYSVSEATPSIYFDSDSMDSTLYEGVFEEAEIGGEAIMVESDSTYYMIQRYDHMEDEEEVSSYLSSSLTAMKQDELEEDLLDYLESNFTVEKNDAMFNKYTATEVYNHNK